MSLHLEMLQVARLSPKLLGDATASVVEFIQSQEDATGGFVDREGKPDLYYTVFGVGCLRALDAALPLDGLKRFVRTVATQRDLDFVHLCSLARCASGSGQEAPAVLVTQLLKRIERYRAADGGYHNAIEGAARGTAYGCFLGLGAYQDLGRMPPDPDRIAECVMSMATPDGAYANEPSVPAGSTNATAAAVSVLRALRAPTAAGVGDWLLARHYARGGFFASPGTPVPDLLSTATALHALAGLQVSVAPIQEPLLDFVDSLWSGRGFHGSWADDGLDCEYTFYGLLALGHLSVAS